MKKTLLLISSAFVLCSLKTNVQAQCNRQQIVDDYNNVYLPSHVSNTDLGWTGDINSCNAGTVSALAHTRTLARVNYFRQLVGLPGNITFDPVLNAKCQDAALMFKANNQLSHFPPNTWTCYTGAGDTAAQKSNIYMGSGSGTFHSSTAVTAWIDDFGTSNTSVGHRRWILYSRANQFGHGSVLGGASALWVINTPTTPATIDFIAWPPEGFFPAPLVPTSNRWSFGIPNADFTNATVTMTDPDNNPVSVTLEPYATGYADNTIVWVVSGITTNNPEDQHYTVNISNVANATNTSYTYVVKIAQPVHPPQCPMGTNWSDNTCDCAPITTSIAEQSNNAVLGLFPNPAANNMELTLTTQDNVNALIDIMDISGRKISSLKTDNKSINIDLSSLSNGMYYITVQNNSKVYKDKFVVSK